MALPAIWDHGSVACCRHEDGRAPSEAKSEPDAEQPRKRPRQAAADGADAGDAERPKASKHSAIDFVAPEPLPRERSTDETAEERAERRAMRAPVREVRGRSEKARAEPERPERPRRGAR